MSLPTFHRSLRARFDAGNGLPGALRPALLLGAAYIGAAMLGFALTFETRPVSTLWFPNAVLLAALLVTPRRTWWTLLAAAFLAHLAVELPLGVPVSMTLCWFVSNSAESLIGVLLIRRFGPQPFRPELFALDRFRNVTVFIGAALTAVFVSCFLDAAFVALNDWGTSGFWTVWRARFFSNTLATLTVVPVILSVRHVRIGVLQVQPRRIAEGALLAAGLVIVSVVVFGWHAAGPESNPALLYVPIPFLLWAVVRFGPVASSTAVIAAVVVSTWNAVDGRGPFASEVPEANAMQIQLLFSIVAVTLMSIAAVLEERRNAQAATHHKGEQLQLALDAAHMGRWEWPVPVPRSGDRTTWLSPDAGARDANTSMESQLGRIHPADRAAVWQEFDRAIHDGSPLDIQFRVAEAGGDIRWMHGKGKVLYDDAGQATRVVGLSADVTEQRMAEQLNTGETRILEMIATGSPLPRVLNAIVNLVESESLGLVCSILVMDEDGIHMRHGAAPGLPKEYIRLIDGLAIGPAVGACGTAMFLARPILSIDIRTDPRWNDYRDAALRHGLRGCWSTPVLSDRGEVLGSFAVYYHYPRSPSAREVQLVELATQLAAIVLERNRTETQLTEQRSALAHLSRVAVLGELLGALAHELRQPLTVMLSGAQAAQMLLASGDARDDRLPSMLGDIVAANRRAGDVIDRVHNLLAKRRPKFMPLSLNDLARDTLNLLESEIRTRAIDVSLGLSPHVPHVSGDRVQLQQVLLNLCMNAFDAMNGNQRDDRAIIITTHGSPDGEHVDLTITDFGTGVPPDALHRVFEPFFTSKENGLGLGLSICRSIVSEHAGRLELVNNPERGATFRVRIPAAVSRAPQVVDVHRLRAAVRD